jgi:adenylate cyclase
VRDVVFREIDRVTVKGKGEPVTIFEPLGMEGSVDRATLDELELWDRALQHYRVQDWDAAQGVLRDLLRLSASSGLYSFYMGRVAALRHEPPGAGWNAVTSFDTK